MLGFTGRERGCYPDHGISGYGASIRLKRPTYADQRVVQQMAETLMISVASKCMELRARAIGHIKCHIHTAAGSVKADTLGADRSAFSSGALSRPVRNLLLSINSLVQGIPEEAVKAATIEGVHETAEEYGFEVYKDKEHMFFDEFEIHDRPVELAQEGADFEEDD